MYSFILKQRPNSYNSNKGKKKINYTRAIQTAFSQINPNHSKLTDDLYAAVYYFFKRDLRLDADNISKPVWDGLINFLYNDDKQIKIRIAGCFDISKNDFNILDISGLEGKMLSKLIEAFDTEEHIIYVECGPFNHKLFKFNIIEHGN